MARRIRELQGAFLLFEITRGDARRKKIALQDLCSLYRRGFVLPSQQVDSIERAINGIVLQDGQDLKVVRWCLNALAQFGRLATCRTYVETALIKYTSDPEIQAAGVAALCRLYRGSVRDIAALRQIDPIIWKLAALQNTDPGKIDLGNLSIDIYNTNAAILRLALITVGLNKDIENLFHPKHSNAAFVRHLAQHDDNVVQQYSVWCVTENHRLGLQDLGIPLDKIETVAPNVQSKLFQLVAEKDSDTQRRLDVTYQGSLSNLVEAREGTAKGVKRHYYDGLEGVIIPWFRQEVSRPVRELLAEHIAAFAADCGPYEDLALETFETDEALQDRLLLGAEGKPLYGKLKAVGPRDLLEGIDAVNDIATAVRESASKKSASRSVLMLTASPLDEEPLRLGAEYRDVSAGVKSIAQPKVNLKFLFQPAVRPRDILTHLLNAEPEIVHFSGHGTKGELVFEDEAGNASSLGTDAIASALKQMTRNLNCVVLNACDSDHLAERLATHVDVVIGCTAPIDDDAAITFSIGFYQAVAAGRSYAESFDFGLANLKTNGYSADVAKYRLRKR
jgi:hypothetical protein